MTTLSTSPASVPSVTEREAVLRERKAFVNGVVCAERARSFGSQNRAMRFIRDGRDPIDVEGIAALEYPMPKITRPRVVPDPIDDNFAWRYVDGALEYERRGSGIWGRSLPWTLHPERVRVLADLVANPTETVEDEESSLAHPHERLGDDNG